MVHFTVVVVNAETLQIISCSQANSRGIAVTSSFAQTADSWPLVYIHHQENVYLVVFWRWTVSLRWSDHKTEHSSHFHSSIAVVYKRDPVLLLESIHFAPHLAWDLGRLSWRRILLLVFSYDKDDFTGMTRITAKGMWGQEAEEAQKNSVSSAGNCSLCQTSVSLDNVAALDAVSFWWRLNLNLRCVEKIKLNIKTKWGWNDEWQK